MSKSGCDPQRLRLRVCEADDGATRRSALGARERAPSKTVSAIVNGGNNYLIVVKRNQKILHRQIEFQTLNTTPIRCFQQTEKTRNRLTHRTVEVFSPPLNLDSRWIGIKSVIKIFRSGIRGNHDYESDSPTYYISSLPPTSSLIAQGIRRHWSIENRLHWGGTDGEPASPY